MRALGRDLARRGHYGLRDICILAVLLDLPEGAWLLVPASPALLDVLAAFDTENEDTEDVRTSRRLLVSSPAGVSRSDRRVGNSGAARAQATARVARPEKQAIAAADDAACNNARKSERDAAGRTRRNAEVPCRSQNKR